MVLGMGEVIPLAFAVVVCFDIDEFIKLTPHHQGLDPLYRK